MPEIATRTTRVTLDAARTIMSGSAKIHSVLVTNGTASNIVVQFSDIDGTNLFDIAVLAHDSNGWDATWIANNGLTVASESSVSVVVTVAHSADGV